MCSSKHSSVYGPLDGCYISSLFPQKKRGDLFVLFRWTCRVYSLVCFIFSMLRRHESHLSLVAMSNSEAAHAIAACLSELSPHRKASSNDSDTFIWALNRWYWTAHACQAVRGSWTSLSRGNLCNWCKSRSRQYEIIVTMNRKKNATRPWENLNLFGLPDNTSSNSLISIY